MIGNKKKRKYWNLLFKTFFWRFSIVILLKGQLNKIEYIYWSYWTVENKIKSKILNIVNQIFAGGILDGCDHCEISYLPSDKTDDKFYLVSNREFDFYLEKRMNLWLTT